MIEQKKLTYEEVCEILDREGAKIRSLKTFFRSLSLMGFALLVVICVYKLAM